MTALDTRDSVERIVAEMRERLVGWDNDCDELAKADDLAKWMDRLSALPHPTINIMCETKEGGVIGTTFLNVIRVTPEDDESFTVVTDYWPK